MLESVDAGASAPASEAVIANSISSEPVKVEVVEDKRSPVQRLDEELSKVWDRNHPSRSPDGKFAPREQTAATEQPTEQAQPEAETVEGEQQEVSADEPQKQEQAPAQPDSPPPHFWSAEMKAKWSSIPPDAQKYIADRDTESQKAVSRLGEQVKKYEPIEQVLQHYKEPITKRGMTEGQAIAILFEAQAKLDRNPVDGLVQIGLGYGIDLRPYLYGQGGQQPQQMTQQSVIDQAIAVAQASLQAKIQQLEGKIEAKERVAYESQQNELKRTINDFAKDKDHFEEVRPLMVTLLQGGQAENLQDAYDMAVHANPQIRQRILEEQRKAEEKKREAEAKAKAEQARKSNAVNVKSAPSTQSPKSLDDELAEIWQRRHG